jgi:plastocyanin
VGHASRGSQRQSTRPRRALLLLTCALCAASATVAAVAIAAPGHRSVSPGHRSADATHAVDAPHTAHAAHACRHARHDHCRRHLGGKRLHRKHKPGASKPALSKRTDTKSTGAATPLTAPPAPVIPGAGSGSGSSGGTSSGAGGSTPPPTETPIAPAGPVHVQVTAEDSNGYHFILSRTSVPAGPVVIEFVNHGQDEHNIHAVEQPAETNEAGGLKENVKPGAHTTLSLNLHTGSYTLFCSLPGHEALGMKATLKVE